MADQYAKSALEHGALPTRQPSTTNKPPPRGKTPFPLSIPVLAHLRSPTTRTILASASPRRHQIFSLLSIPFTITPSLKPENLSKSELGPFNYVLQTCIQKVLDVYTIALETSIASIPDPSLVVGADTVVVTNSGLILEKPRNEKEHIAMLKMLRDQKTHKVYTAVAVLAPREDARAPGYNLETTVEETKVYFSEESSDELIEAYVKTREGADKAGGYGMQGMGGLLVEKIEGAADNVVGLPLRVTLALIEKAIFNQGDPEEEGEEEEE